MNDEKKKGCYAIIIWLVLSSFYFYQFIARSSFITILTNEFMQYFRIEAAGIGFLGSCYYLTYTLMQIPAGVIVDKSNLRTIAPVATMICALGLYTLIAVEGCQTCAAIGQMLIGFGSAFSLLMIVKAITEWFPLEKIAIMVSLTVSVGCLGPVFGGPAVAYIVKYHNWLDVIKVYCVAGVILAALIWFIVRDKEGSTHIESMDSEKIGLGEALKRIISSKQIWVLSFLILAMYAPISALGDLWGVSFIKVAYNLDSEMAAIVNNMLYLGMVIGAPAFAYFASCINSYKKPMIIGSFGIFIFLSIIVYMSSYVSTFMLFVLFFATGFSCGAMLEYPLALALFPKSMGATITGFINMMSMFSGIVLMPTVGLVIQHFWNGKIVDGVEIYTLENYVYGLTPVVLFSLAGVIISFFVTDRKLRET